MRRILVSLTLLSILCLCGTALGFIPQYKWSQLPTFDNSWQSQWDYNGNAPATVRADDWICEDGLPIDKVKWWGAEMFTQLNDPVQFDGFSVQIFDDLGGSPGNLLKEDFFTMAEISIIDTSSTNPLGDPVYSYEVEFDQFFDQVQGQTYWLSIIAVTPDAESLQEWRWQEAIEGLNDSSVLGDIIGQGTPDSPDINYLSWVYQDHDLAFELGVIPEPGTMFMMSSGVVGLFLMIRRRRKTAHTA